MHYAIKHKAEARKNRKYLQNVWNEKEFLEIQSMRILFSLIEKKKVKEIKDKI